MNPIILNQETLAEILIKCSDFIVKAPRLIFNNNVPELSAKEKFLAGDYFRGRPEIYFPCGCFFSSY